MNTLRQLVVALVITLALTTSAFAGEMETGRTAPPTPTTTRVGEIQIGITGQMDTVNSEAATADSATEIVLNLLQSVLALF